jgi:3-hydroxybutyryl-CoA dehydrogenase
MSAILLFGNPSFAETFRSAIPGDYDVRIIDPAHLDDPSVENFPDGIACIVDLTVDLDEKLRCADFVGSSAAGAIYFTNILTTTATWVAGAFDGVTVVGISYVPALFASSSLIEAAPALQCSEEDAARAIELLGAITGRRIERVIDRVALVSMRALAMIINEAAFALMEGVADAADIDTAMKLGTNYPEGPLRWADTIGAEIIVETLLALQEEYGEERYRPCVLLKQMARAGKPFHES